MAPAAASTLAWVTSVAKQFQLFQPIGGVSEIRSPTTSDRTRSADPLSLVAHPQSRVARSTPRSARVAVPARAAAAARTTATKAGRAAAIAARYGWPRGVTTARRPAV